MVHIRLIHKFLSPTNIWPISADRPNIWIFQIFYPRNFCGIAFFSEIYFSEQNFRYPERVKKNEKLFGERHNIKELSHQIFECAHKRHEKIQFFRFFVFCNFGFFSLKKCAFSPIIFFTFFSFFQKKNLIFF